MSRRVEVWDISHYLVRGRGCSDEEHAERQALWDSFPMIPWLKWLEDVHMLHLDFHCMRKAHEWNTPHLLTSFRGHSTVINSIAHFENNLGRWVDVRTCSECKERACLVPASIMSDIATGHPERTAKYASSKPQQVQSLFICYRLALWNWYCIAACIIIHAAIQHQIQKANRK